LRSYEKDVDIDDRLKSYLKIWVNKEHEINVLFNLILLGVRLTLFVRQDRHCLYVTLRSVNATIVDVEKT
jgi:hypothetical protein